MFGNDRKLRAAMILALVDLNQRLTALEPKADEETVLEEIRNVVRGTESGVYSLQDRTYNLERLHSAFVQAVGSLTEKVQEVNDRTQSASYYNREVVEQGNKLAAKIDRVVERQSTTEQLLDAIRVYAAERTARDEQAAQPDGTENGSRV
jgi:predicted  nucleic acid-binding Zn-ribbon protein